MIFLGILNTILLLWLPWILAQYLDQPLQNSCASLGSDFISVGSISPSMNSAENPSLVFQVLDALSWNKSWLGAAPAGILLLHPGAGILYLMALGMGQPSSVPFQKNKNRLGCKSLEWGNWEGVRGLCRLRVGTPQDQHLEFLRLDDLEVLFLKMVWGSRQHRQHIFGTHFSYCCFIVCSWVVFMYNSEKKNQIYGAGLNARGVCNFLIFQKKRKGFPGFAGGKRELVIAAFLPETLTKVEK